jgi:spore maturation protein CgeB
MRIFTAVRHSNDPAYYYGGLWSRNFYPALREMEHAIVESQVDLLPTSRFMDIKGDFTPQELEVRAKTTEKIIEEVTRAHKQKPVDIFLSYFYNAHFEPSGFDELRRLGIPSVNFYCNSIHQFHYVAAIAAKADFSWHPEKNARQLYLNVGANPVWVQMAADPKVYRPVENLPRSVACCFVGQRYADRDRWLGALIRENVPVEIYGSSWIASARSPSSDSSIWLQQEYLGRPTVRPGAMASYLAVARETLAKEGPLRGAVRLAKQWRYLRGTKSLMPLCTSHARGFAPNVADIFSAYEVILNFSNVWSDGTPGSKLIPHVRLRDFEAPMCRTCYLTGYTDEITEFYEPDREIVTYRSEPELVQKAKYYLAQPTAAEKIRQAGYVKAVKDHTWTRRFTQLFSAVGLQT